MAAAYLQFYSIIFHYYSNIPGCQGARTKHKGMKQTQKERERARENRGRAKTKKHATILTFLLILEQELKVKFRRADSLCSALKEGHTMLLASITEMMQYVLYLRSSPAKAAALLSTVEDETTKDAVLKALEEEWRLVLALEGSPAGAMLLRQHCSFCSFQQYREVMTVYEKNDWKVTPETTALTAAWFPQMAWSASLESIFGDLQDATKRAGRSDCGSLPNLFAVGVRSLQNRLCVQEGSTSPVKLEAGDWTGTQALGVKPKAFNPASAPACSWAVSSLSACGVLSILSRAINHHLPQAGMWWWTTS